jgi:tetratricopeptide (TPR) repeat protein
MIARLDLLMAGPPRQAALSSTSLVRALVLKGDVAIDQGHYAEAEAAARRALAIAQVSLGDVKAAPAAALMLAESMLYGTHTAEDALAEAEKTLHIVRAAHQREPRHPHVLDARMIYGRALGNADRLEEAIAEIAAAAQVAREVFGAESQTVAFYLQNLARFQRKQGDLRGTLASASEALAIQSKIARHDSFNFLGALFTHAMALGAVRRNVEALDELETVAAGYSAVFGSSHPETLSARINRASLLPYSGRGSEAKAELKRIVDLRRGDDAYRRFVPLFVLGRVYRLEGEYEQALEVQKNARVLLGDDPARLADQVNLAVEVGLASLELGRGAEAREAFEFARANQVPTGSGASPGAADLSLAFARLALLEHDPGRALPLLMEVEEFWRNFDAGNRGAGVAAAWLGRCYLALRDSGAAKSAFARARPLLQVSKLSSDRNLLRLSQAR